MSTLAHKATGRIVVRASDAFTVRMAKSAAWLYWLAAGVVIAGSVLPVEQPFDRTPVLLLAAGGLAASVFLILMPWQKVDYRVFYLFAALACSHTATLVYFSSGVESPYGLLYFIIAVWAAYFFTFTGFAYVGALCIGSFMLPFFYDSEYNISHITTGLIKMLFLLITGGLVNLLVTQVRQRNWELRRINEQLDLKMREVVREEEKTQAVLSSVADGVYVVDNNQRIVLWNHAAEIITGFSSEEMIGRECSRAVQDAGGEASQCATPICSTAAGIQAGAASVSYEVLTCRKDETNIWLSVSAAPIHDPDGTVVGIVHVFRDISEYKEIDRMKSDFVATVSHELRTPLTSILGFSKTLLRNDVQFSEESRQSFLQEIVKEGERLARLIEDVLSVSRIEAGSLKVDLRAADPAPTVRQVVKNVSRLTTIHNFVVQVPEDLPPVMADTDKLYQVLLNLVVNAVKYSPDGGQVTVSVAPGEAGTVRFMVADRGIGISEEHMPHIFERFYRVEPRARGTTSTGLGLYVSKNLVEQMGGRIWAESRIGEGSRFFFELPVAYSDQESRRDDSLVVGGGR